MNLIKKMLQEFARRRARRNRSAEAGSTRSVFVPMQPLGGFRTLRKLKRVYEVRKLVHACSARQAARFAVVSRQIVRRLKFENAMTHINRIAGGEPRAIRRSMARALSKRVVVA